MDRTRELTLVAGLREGEARAFDEVYDLYRPRLYSFLLRLSRQRELAEDLLQETWLRLASHAARLEQETRLGPWLFTVARNLYRSHVRFTLVDPGRSWPKSAPEPADHLSPFEHTSAGELRRRLEAALAALPLKYREVLLLVAVERMDQAAAAEVLGLRPDALRQRLARARDMVARWLAPGRQEDYSSERSA